MCRYFSLFGRGPIKWISISWDFLSDILCAFLVIVLEIKSCSDIVCRTV